MALKKTEGKLTKLKTEREKFEAQLKEILDKIKGNDSLTEETENTLIVELVRDMKITPDTLKEILNARKSEDFISTKDIPAIITESEPETEAEPTANIFERDLTEYE